MDCHQQQCDYKQHQRKTNELDFVRFYRLLGTNIRNIQRGCPISFQIFMMDLFKPIVRIFPAIAEQYTLFCRKTIDKCYPQQWELFKNEARRIVQSLIETGSREPRIIYLAHYFQLEGYFAYYCLNWMLTQSPKKILHLFANYDSNELIQELTNKYITGCIEMKDLKKAE